jgi:hypothetical protein
MKRSVSFNITERKSSGFGQVTVLDTQDSHVSAGYNYSYYPHGYYDDFNRSDIYKVCRSKYIYDQLARPIINLIVNALFNSPPDFQGDKKLVKIAEKVATRNSLDWHQIGVDLEVNGDVFLRIFDDATPTVASIPPETMTIDYDPQNVLSVNNFIQYYNNPGQITIPAEEIVHVKINVPSNVIYGSSTLRPILWWLDVLDNLFERNWIRSAQYYGAPVVTINGVPPEHQATVKSSVEAVGWRPGRCLVLPADSKADVLDFAKQFPIEQIIDRVYQYILSACSIPQHLIYESDSSRGVAMFSGDGFDWLIRSRQQVWSLALYNIFKRIFERKGVWTADSEFKIGWTPTFQRDLKDLAQVVDVLVSNSALSKRTAREMFGIDHSSEVERLKTQKTEEPQDQIQPGLPKVPSKVQPPAEDTDSE